MSATVEIKLTGYGVQQLVDQVAAAVREDAQERINDAVRGAIKEAIDAAVLDLTRERIAAEVSAVMAEGWQPTDGYGNPNGEKLTLRQRVSKAISSQLDRHDSYDRKTPVQKMVEEAVSKALGNEVGAELKRAKEAIREQVDTLINSKLREAIGGALGLQVRS